MSEGTTQAIVPALIALAGTILTILVGIWQWRRQARIQQVTPFLSDKQAAYKGLWEKLEEVHVRIRVDTLNKPETKKLLQETNEYILKNSLYLESEDHILANAYLSELQRFAALVAQDNDAQLKAAWEITGPVAPEAVQAATMFRELEQIRNRILDRCRSVIQTPVIP